MKMNTDAIVKKFKTTIFTANIILAIISILIILLPQNILSIPFAFIFYILGIKITSTVAVNNILFPILKQHTDPHMFLDIINKLNICTDNAAEHIITSYLIGDYQQTINICFAKLKNTAQQRYAHIYYTYIARCYFDLGDNESLSKTLDDFDRFIKSSKKGDEIKAKCTLMRFFRFYLDKDFNSCKEIYENVLNNKNFGDDLLSEIQTKFTYAVACYKSGDIEKANEIFKFIISSAPKLVYSEMSQKYLNNTIDERKVVRISPQSDFSLSQLKRSKISWAKVILYVGLFISLTAVLVFTLTQTDMSFKLF